MTLGVILLVHEALDRAMTTARHWAGAGCAVVIHVDAKLPPRAEETLRTGLADLPLVRFAPRLRCDWGSWSIVAATLGAARLLLDGNAPVERVFLASGACLPLRPIQELRDYLAGFSDTDFIESTRTDGISWTVGGLEQERFSLWFPFHWKRQRRLFDLCVTVQRKLGLRRALPDGIVPHIGSQWWCLTRRTLEHILNDPDLPRFEQFFRRVWIPDESFFQTLARRHSTRIESRSLTFSRFDFQGKPCIFYDDHLPLLRRSGCFVARKIWPGAEALYAGLPTPAPASTALPDPVRITAVCDHARTLRTRGRAGLRMAGRDPNPGWENGQSAAPFWVLQGFAPLYTNINGWIAQHSGADPHGTLFGPGDAQFADAAPVAPGGLSASAAIRDDAPRDFLRNLVWNHRARQLCFHHAPDSNRSIDWDLARDPNARIAVISGSWAIGLCQAETDFDTARSAAARFQREEARFLGILRSRHCRAQVRIWSLAEALDTPMEPLRALAADLRGDAPATLGEAPQIADLRALRGFLQALRNHGMHPHLIGDLPVPAPPPNAPARAWRVG